MAITPTCDKCGRELMQFGAILLGPPDAENKALKFHLCVDCYEQYRATLKKITLPKSRLA